MKTLTHLIIAAAAIVCAAPAAQAGLCTDGVCQYKVSKSNAYGNSKFGAAYDFDFITYNKAGTVADAEQSIATLEQFASMLPSPANQTYLNMAASERRMLAEFEATIADDRLIVKGDADVVATVFGDDQSLLDIGGYVLLNEGSLSMGLSAKVLGGSIALPSFDSEGMTLFEQSLTFFQAQATYMAGPVPLTVKGSVSGTLGLDASVAASGGIHLGLTPNAALTAEASVGVGVACASAGVRGSIDLLAVRVPSDLKLISQACGMTADLTSKLHLSSMNGSIEVYAEACGLEWSEEIVSWTGKTFNPSTIVKKNTTCL